MHTKLGKPIPSTEPSMVSQTATTTTAVKPPTPNPPMGSSSGMAAATPNVSTIVKTNPVAAVSINNVTNKLLAVKKAPTPKITFIGKYSGLSSFLPVLC